MGTVCIYRASPHKLNSKYDAYTPQQYVTKAWILEAFRGMEIRAGMVLYNPSSHVSSSPSVF